MKCPFCGTTDTQVLETRLSDEGDNVRRRRRCVTCDKRFTTFEVAELRPPQVVKRHGNRVEFNREKIHQSFNRALHKRLVPTELVDDAVTRIEQKVLSLAEREIESLRIGEMVMAELAKLDKVAYIRFASVYKSFQDVDDFKDAIREVSRKKP
jgi:transcriptional repressor NrdR